MRTSTGLIAGAVFAALSLGQAHATITGLDTGQSIEIERDKGRRS